MKLVIIPIDGSVYVDGLSYSGLDLSFCPQDVHALQWKDSFGWVEHVERSDGTKPQNVSITELPSWAGQAYSQWLAAKVAEEEAIKAAQEALEKTSPIPTSVAA